jgi:hypothetical protein
VVLRHVAALDEEHFGVLQVQPVIGHRAPAEGGPQTGDRGAVSKARLVFHLDTAHQARQFR